MEKIIYECGHCGKKNPENLGYRGMNCCNECLKDLKYFVVYDDDFGFVIKLTIPLTKKSAEDWIELQKKETWRNLRYVTFEEFEVLDGIREVSALKLEIKDTKRKLIELELSLAIKRKMEEELRPEYIEKLKKIEKEDEN